MISERFLPDSRSGQTVACPASCRWSRIVRDRVLKSTFSIDPI